MSHNPSIAMSIAFAALLLALPVSRAARAEDFAPATFTGSDGKTIPYRLFKPNEYDAKKKYPLVIFFHGAGERGTDNARQIGNGMDVFAKPENQAKYPCFIVAPQCPGEQQWVNVPWGDDTEVQPAEPSQTLRLSMELLDSLQKEYSIDSKRLYITGLSMGGFATWDAITRWPDRFAAAVPICGGGDETKAEKIAKLPLWAFHGSNDDVVKTHRSRDMIAAMKKAGGNPKYTEVPNVGHFAWGAAYSDPNLITWMFAQSRK